MTPRSVSSVAAASDASAAAARSSSFDTIAAPSNSATSAGEGCLELGPSFLPGGLLDSASRSRRFRSRTTFASNFNKVKTSTNCLFGETNVVSGHGRADRRPSAHDDDASPIPCPGVVPASSFFAPYCRRRHLFSLCVPFLTWLTPCSRLQFSAVINLCGIINLNWYQFELREWSLVVLALAAAGAAPSSTPDRYPDSPLRS